ncbi:MAG: AAA domain-containing protein [Bacteroidota bacterium]
MPFKSYLVKKYEFSHENEFFRKFSANLEKAFGNSATLSALIGNVNVNGHQLDAIFITHGQISVIDFKDYKGHLTFSENNVWRLKTDSGQLTFVKGGSAIRNPFQQVRAYKYSLLDLLQSKQDNILETNHENINWTHISAIVLFQNRITIINPEEVPNAVKRWFSIRDMLGIINTLKDKHSVGMALSNTEIENVLTALHISEDMLLSSHTFTEEFLDATTEKIDPQRFHAIQKMLDEGIPVSNSGKALKYYKTLIKAEQYKQVAATNISIIPIEKCGSLEAIEIPFKEIPSFYVAYVATNSTNFPKDIFVGLQLILDNENFPLLHSIIPNKDVARKNVISIDPNTLEIHEPTLEKLELGEELVEDIKNKLFAYGDLSEKIAFLQEILGMSIRIGEDLLIGLSQEELYTAQLKWELNKLEQKEIKPDSLFESFLLNKPIITKPRSLKSTPLVEITPLNTSQRTAIQQTFAQPLSIITGPPGTGKTQVILNIIANAIVHDHTTVLVSRNNKAVDNVLYKMDKLLDDTYLVKFGSKSLLEEKTKPFLRSIINSIGQQPKDATATFKKSVDDFEVKMNRITSLRKYFASYKPLLSKQKELTIAIAEVAKEIVQWLQEQSKEKTQLSHDFTQNIKYDQNGATRMYQKIVGLENSWLKRIFYKKKTIKAIADFYESLTEDIQEYVDNHFPYVQLNKDPLRSGKEFLSQLIDLKKDISQLLSEYQTLKDKKEELTKELHRVEASIQLIDTNREKYLSEIESYEASLTTVSTQIVSNAIKSHISQLSSNAGYDYVASLPNKTWRDHEVAQFVADTSTFMEHYKVMAITNLTVKNSLPLQPEIIDLLIVDEASQCDIASIIPLLYRAKRVAIIGDPMQLKHITSIQKYESEFVINHLDMKNLHLDYVNNSLYDYCNQIAVKSNLQSTFLESHYRCHPEIIEFSNYYIYKSGLGQEMKIETEVTTDTTNPGLQWVHVKGEMHRDKNTNDKEIAVIYHLVKQIKAQNPDKSLGITTPFRHQKEKLRAQLSSLLATNDEIIIDTVHRFQGDEKDIMIFSLVIAENSPESKVRFLNRNKYLLNVGITRAIASLYVVGNYTYCLGLEKKLGRNVLSDLAKYSKNIKKVIEVNI